MAVKIADSLNSTITLKDGVVMPMFGLGMFKSGSVMLFHCYQYIRGFSKWRLSRCLVDKWVCDGFATAQLNLISTKSHITVHLKQIPSHPHLPTR